MSGAEPDNHAKNLKVQAGKDQPSLNAEKPPHSHQERRTHPRLQKRESQGSKARDREDFLKERHAYS